MAYSTGVATDAVDLLQKLVSWLTTSRGWTSDTSASSGSGWRATLHKGSFYINFRAAAAGENVSLPSGSFTSSARALYLYPGTGYNGSNGPFAQAGGPITASGSLATAAGMQCGISGSFSSYDFFDDGNDNIFIVIEKSPNIFNHCGFGPSWTKNGTITGGAWCSSSNQAYYAQYNGGSSTPGEQITARCPMAYGVGFATGLAGHGFFRCDVDSFTGKYLTGNGGTTLSPSFASSDGWTGKGVWGWAPGGSSNTANEIPGVPFLGGKILMAASGQPCLIPIRLFAERDAGGVTDIGSLPALYYCDAVGNGFSARSIYSLGADNYMLYPTFAVKKV